MAQIGKRTFTEGRGIYAGSPESPSLNEALRDVADDLAGIKPLTVASPDAVPAAGNPPTQAEFNAAVTLLNEIKAVLNLVATASIRTEKV